MRVLQIIFGIILLLPGICSVVFMQGMSTQGAGPLWVLWIGTFVLAALGIMLIFKKNQPK